MNSFLQKMTMGALALSGGLMAYAADDAPVVTDAPAKDSTSVLTDAPVMEKTTVKKAPVKNTKPNILVIFGDDIGLMNISYNNHGMMGYKTENIDRIARNGMTFTDYYAEQSCTAGRAAFITGQSPFRTGLTKVGMPGADIGLQKEDPTIADIMKSLGYATGQFGKNHLGDRDEYLPINHGFDEFFGNLYHLNAEEEPEHPMYPKDPAFKAKHGPRGVIKAYSDGTIIDTGPLTKKRMETVDQEFVAAALDFMERKTEAQEPFFLWFNATRMHYPTHPSPEIQGQTGYGDYADGMVEHDKHVGILLDKLEELGIDENTIVIYTTDNGPHYSMWPDGGITMFRSEKNTNWEGAFRVPIFVSWPNHIQPGRVCNELVSHLDWLPTLAAIGGDPDVKAKLLKGYKVGKKKFKVHLDGYNMLDLLEGKTEESPRKNFFYFSDDGLPMAIRTGDWKVIFAVQRAHGMAVWREPFVRLRMPILLNLRMDPYERAHEDSENYFKFQSDHAFIIYQARDEFKEFIQTFKEFPPRQRPASFSVDQIFKKTIMSKK